MTDLVDKLTDDLMTVDGHDAAKIRSFAGKEGFAAYADLLRQYEQLAIQAMTTIRFHLEQDGEL